MNSQEFRDYIEQYMDSQGLSAVLSEVATVCREKSEHVANAWQDKELAKIWDKAARKIDMLTMIVDDPLA